MYSVYAEIQKRGSVRGRQVCSALPAVRYIGPYAAFGHILSAALRRWARFQAVACSRTNNLSMCGIAGVWHPVGDLESTVRAMTSRIRHRGPDADGHEILAGEGLALGHRRLSIVDLSPTGAQPMYSSSGRYCVVFNGEIYNFRELRREFAAHGQVFRGSSDTEVMLAAFEAYGVQGSLHRLAGMFSFATWDVKERVLWLARDRMGEKPLYYGQFGNTVAFASELKSLRSLANCPREIDPAAVTDVLERGFVRGERTILAGVLKLKPGHCLRIERTDARVHLSSHCYWSVPEILATVNGSKPHDTSGDDEATDALDALLGSVVRDEMLADVPIGAFLSGGIDSSLIVAVMQRVSSEPVRTFTIGFDEGEFDESPHASKVAAHLGTQHTSIRLRADDALDFVDRLPEVFDEPFADSSQLPTLLVCQATRQHVTVALSGDGGDELFGGYSQYLGRDSVASLAQKVPAIMRESMASVVSRVPERLWGALSPGSAWPPHSQARLERALSANSPRVTFEGLVSEWAEPNMVLAPHRRRTVDSADPLTIDWPRARSEREAQMAYDIQTYLPDDILVKVDRCAMAVSLETRAPLLDHRVVEFALGQPLTRKIRQGTGKFLLRRLLHRYLPSTLWDRPKKAALYAFGRVDRVQGNRTGDTG